MAVEVLRPQDPLRNRYHTHTSPFHRRRNFPPAGEGVPQLSVSQKKLTAASQKKSANPNNNTFNTSPKPDKKKIKKSPKSPHGSAGATVAPPPVLGQVTILKRGESLASISRSTRSENPNPNRNPNPNPNLNSNQSLGGLSKIKVADVYAGSGFVISPSPRSLPLPSFGRKESSDDASETLRRLLGL